MTELIRGPFHHGLLVAQMVGQKEQGEESSPCYSFTSYFCEGFFT